MPIGSHGRATLAIALVVLAAGCARGRGHGGDDPAEPDTLIAARATRAIIERHTRELADDRYEGRYPGTRGESLTTAYLEGAFRGLGLAPGNPDGTYVQWLTLQAQRTTSRATLRLRGATSPLPSPGEAVFVATRAGVRTALSESELVFAGHGIVAPEYAWDDYAGVDVRGKTVLVLRDEPEPRLASDSSRLDPSLFRGAQITRHATIERKRAVAFERGAAAILLLAAGAPGFRLQATRFTDEYITLGSEQWPAVIGVLAPAAKARVFSAAGRDVRADSLAAGRRGFRAIPLGSTLTLALESRWRTVRTRNMAARIDGRDPRARGEHVIVSAHWDAFGIGRAVDGDSIYNGAVDDAVGVGQLLAVAEALVSRRQRPRRSVLFLVTTAEEPGLLGARHYAAHPLWPLSHALLNVNFDLVHLAGPTRDVRLYGGGRSTLDDEVRAAAALQGRVVVGETEPSTTWFLQDHFAFAEAGVPALSVASGSDVVGRPAGWSALRAEEYRTRHYHRPSDEVRDDWDWGSVVQDAQLGVLLTLRTTEGGRRVRPAPGADVRMGVTPPD